MRGRALLLASLLGLVAGALHAQTLERPPYLQQATHDAIIVRWRTDVPTDTRLRYGATPRTLDTVVSLPGTRTEHEVALSGLTPDSLYHYDVGSSRAVLAGGDTDHYFRTSPLPGTDTPFRIWVLGDSGRPNAAAARVRNAFFAFTGGESPDMVVMLGDNAYGDGTDLDHTLGVFQGFSAVLRNTPLWPTPGNHDFVTADAPTQTGAYFEAFTLPTGAEAGGVPSGTEAYYSFDYGNVHFVTLDSTGTGKGLTQPMYLWLEADLMANTREWVIAIWHHPAYSKGSHDSDTTRAMILMRENFVPLLEDFAVDLVLAGHSHAYERSMLIDGHYGDSLTFGAAHIVDGGDGDPSGTGPYQKANGGVPHAGGVFAVVGSSSGLSIGGGTFDHPAMVRSIAALGSAVIDISSNTLNARFLDDLGVVRDEFEIVKGQTCADGVDNDSDGLVDMLDLGCADAADLTETDPALACDDGVDNDADGLLDFPSDPGCYSRDDATEQSVALACDNGQDDDLDGPADTLDPGCSDAFDASEQSSNVECDDGVDNDGDELADSADPDCVNPGVMSESPPPVQNLSIPIATDNDDVEERVATDGAIVFRSTDLELVEDTVVQAVGLRFVGVAIPKDARILAASIQFTVAAVSSLPAALTVAAEMSDDAPPFSAAPFDVSNRQKTQRVDWNPPAWLGVGFAGPVEQTPDLSSLVQEIVERSGWTQGNAIVFVVEGRGRRTVESSAGTSGGAPRLEVTFAPEPSATLQRIAALALLLWMGRGRMVREAVSSTPA